MMEQIEEVSTLVTLLNRHREEVAGVWAEMVRRLPNSHYGERPLDELRASTLRAVEAIIEALATHSYTALEIYLNEVSLTRLQMGFDISEVIEALLLCKEATLPIIWESFSPRSPEAHEAIVQLDDCLRHMIGLFGRLYAEAMNRSLEEQQQHIALMLTESQSLGRVTAALLQKIDLVDVLDIVCTEAQALTGAMGSTVFLLDAERDGWLRVARSSGVAPPNLERIPIEESLTGIAVREGKPFVSNDTASEAQAYHGRGKEEPTSLLAVPLNVKGVVIGTLDMVNKPGGFTQEDVRIISLIADQAAIAIENASLYQQAQELAAAQERQRLARDLHDAVTQTLFSASLIAEVLPRIWERDPEEGQRRLKELRELTRGALAEMRTLLLELRPAALVEARLTDLLHQIAESITGWARVPVTVEVEGECDLPLEVKVALYRIAHEALYNMAKWPNTPPPASRSRISIRSRL
jgi:signal transduction histidine kinase